MKIELKNSWVNWPVCEMFMPSLSIGANMKNKTEERNSYPVRRLWKPPEKWFE